MDNELWEANRDDQNGNTANRNPDAESVIWLNSLLAAVWPLVNPDLFTSVADTLEDGEMHLSAVYSCAGKYLTDTLG